MESTIQHHFASPQPERSTPTRPRSIRFRLACLVLACILPVCLIAGLLVYYSYQHKRSSLERSALETTRALSAAVDRELASVQGTLTTLATSPLLEAGNLYAFHRQIQAVLRQYPGSRIVLADSTGQQLVNSLIPFGQPLPKRNNPDGVHEVFATGRPVISNLIKGAITGTPRLTVEVPVFREERVIYDLSLSIPAEQLSAMTPQQSIPPGWTLAVMDRNSVLVVRSRLAERYVGEPSSPPLAKRASEIAEGSVEYVGKEGKELLTVFSRSAATGWVTAIAIPKAEFSAAVWQSLKWAICGLALILFIGIGTALYFAGRIAGSIEALIVPALAVGSGEPVRVDQLDLAETVKVGQALAKASDRLQQHAVEQRRAEAELKQHRDQLEELVKQRTNQLEAANAQLQVDIAERKRAEETARQLAAIVEFSDEAIIGKTLDGTITSWNRGAQQLYGYTAQEVLGRRISLLVPSGETDEIPPLLERLRNGEAIELYESLRQRKDGTLVPVLLKISPLKDSSGAIIGASSSALDITARKRAEEALRQSLERLERVMEIETVGVMFWDLNTGCMVDANDTFLKLMGYSRSQVEARELTWQKLTPPEYIDVSRAEVEKFLATGRVGPYEKEYFRKDGTRRWLLFAGSSLGNNQCVEFCVDIADRKKMEQALQESESQFRTLANAIPQLCWTANADGWIFWYNTRWYEHTGTTPEQMEGWGWQSVHNPETLPRVMEEWQTSIATGQPFDMVFPLRGADGVFRPFLTRVMPLKDANGKVVRWFGTNTDVTELRNAQEALRASEERWATTLQSIGDAVISTCAEGKIIFMNEVAQKLTGWSLSEAKGRHLDEVFNIVQEVTRIKPESPVSNVVRAGLVVGLANHTLLVRRDGTEIPIEDSGAPIRNREGQIEGVVLVFHDVSEQRKMQQAVRNSDRLATTGRLAATIAHEIHNPLDTVGNLLFLVQQRTQEAQTREHVSLASEELARVTKMTQQMLTFQRESAEPVPVRIEEVIESVLGLYQRKIESAAIRIETEIDVPQPMLAQPGELRQVFANLLGNAIEAVGRDHGRIRLRAGVVRDWRNGCSGVRVMIADNGRGIPAELREKIFDPFFTTKGESGTGLGLWITADLIRKYGGTMRLRSITQPSRCGTCFSVFFPSGKGTG